MRHRTGRERRGVETPQRTQEAVRRSDDPPLTDRHPDFATQRGVSTEGPTPHRHPALCRMTNAVGTHQRPQDGVRASDDPPLAERHPHYAIQRGVSTEGPVLFNGRFRVQSARLPGWDYRWAGYYFVTICTKNRAPFLGDIVDRRMRLSKAGEIVAAEWRGMAARRRDVSLDEWVVMPNHVHGILAIVRDRGVETPQRERSGDPKPNDHNSKEPHPDIEMQRGVSTGNAPRLLPGSLGAIVGQFKSGSTKRMWQAGFREFGWQPRFYDHIIRDESSLDHIRQYIIDNPAKWDPTEGMTENLWI